MDGAIGTHQRTMKVVRLAEVRQGALRIIELAGPDRCHETQRFDLHRHNAALAGRDQHLLLHRQRLIQSLQTSQHRCQPHQPVQPTGRRHPGRIQQRQRLIQCGRARLGLPGNRLGHRHAGGGGQALIGRGPGSAQHFPGRGLGLGRAHHHQLVAAFQRLSLWRDRQHRLRHRRCGSAERQDHHDQPHGTGRTFHDPGSRGTSGDPL